MRPKMSLTDNTLPGSFSDHVMDVRAVVFMLRHFDGFEFPGMQETWHLESYHLQCSEVQKIHYGVLVT